MSQLIPCEVYSSRGVGTGGGGGGVVWNAGAPNLRLQALGNARLKTHTCAKKARIQWSSPMKKTSSYTLEQSQFCIMAT